MTIAPGRRGHDSGRYYLFTSMIMAGGTWAMLPALFAVSATFTIGGSPTAHTISILWAWGTFIFFLVTVPVEWRWPPTWFGRLALGLAYLLVIFACVRNVLVAFRFLEICADGGMVFGDEPLEWILRWYLDR